MLEEAIVGGYRRDLAERSRVLEEYLELKAMDKAESRRKKD